MKDMTYRLKSWHVIRGITYDNLTTPQWKLENTAAGFGVPENKIFGVYLWRIKWGLIFQYSYTIY